MLFSSLIFIFRFMPIFFIIYYLVPARWKNAVLFSGSLIFYAVGELKYVPLVLAAIGVNYFLVRAMGPKESEEAYDPDISGEARIRLMRRERKEQLRRRFLLSMALTFDIGMLVLFKYTSFILKTIDGILHIGLTIPEIPLPLGISFYTFQIMSYCIDVYRGTTRPARNILKLGTYLIAFPQLIAGPIVIYEKVSRALDHRTILPEGVDRGLRIFTLGLGSKVILANQLGTIWSAAEEAGFQQISSSFAWLAAVAYSLQLYFDFNGYSLMAIGLGEMLGFHFPQNFNFPYISASVTEFWRRWHMTLTAWFRDYLYIPLGGNRAGTLRTYLNMLVVWTVTGLWHGADWSFVLWGLYYFVLISLEKLFLHRVLKYSAIFSRIYTLLIVICGWVLFAANSLGDALECLKKMFIPYRGVEFGNMGQAAVVLLSGVLFATPVFSRLYKKFETSLVVVPVLFVIFWASVVLLAHAVYNPFLYFRF